MNHHVVPYVCPRLILSWISPDILNMKSSQWHCDLTCCALANFLQCWIPGKFRNEKKLKEFHEILVWWSKDLTILLISRMFDEVESSSDGRLWQAAYLVLRVVFNEISDWNNLKLHPQNVVIKFCSVKRPPSWWRWSPPPLSGICPLLTPKRKILVMPLLPTWLTRQDCWK